MVTITQEQIEEAEKNLAVLKKNQANDSCAKSSRNEWRGLVYGSISEPSPCQTPGPAQRRPQVHQELEELGYAIDSLEKAIAGLHDRLSMVTREVQPCPQCAPETAEMQKVPLSNIISEYRKKVRLFQKIVTDLTDRVEV